ncbi:MAG: glycoside hydrolase family 2 TIM barrel-domain containing protein, partial [Lachnospiraceae bacterium]|nr:glycoside hydrolase family 2 TIM barrel-domain containing protein [Lachnospiraceae bacterium]
KQDYAGNNALAKDLIFMGGRQTYSLNGEWHYAIDQYDTCLRQKWFLEQYFDKDGRSLPVDFSFQDWPTISLPCSVNTEKPELFWYEGPLVFTRTFSWDMQENMGKKVFLRIGAANYFSYVFLNGKYICKHEGGSTPFMWDVTEYLEKENRILIVSDNTRNHLFVPTENTDWFNYSGVYRDIELVALPTEYLKDLKVNLVPHSDFSQIRIAAETSADSGIVTVEIPELQIATSMEIQNGKGEIVVEARPNLWSPETPILYDVTATFGQDKVVDRVGFREISVEGRDILLNGKKLFLRGVSVHEDSQFTGKALRDEERLTIIRTAKELGANYLRLAHYPHHENMAKLCDDQGILLWEEIPVYWAIAFDNPATYNNARNQLEELMCRDFNRASVIIWSVGNENLDSDDRFRFMGNLADFAHQYDNTRMVSAACLVDGETLSIKDRLAEKLDIIGVNEYIGWYSPNFEELPQLMNNSNPTKPVIISEFGADATPGLHGSVDDKGTEECQEAIYRKQIEVIRQIPYIKGITPWILFDFRCPRRTAAIQGYYNRKGLVSSDRTYYKPAFSVLQSFYREF